MKELSDSDLLEKAKALASEERKAQVELLWYLLEIQNRRLFLEIGYSSLYDYVVRELGYSHGAAYRRIQAMRLLESVPAVAAKLEEGSLSLCTAAQAQKFIGAERASGGHLSYRERVDLVCGIENKSAREVEKHLIALKPENVIPAEKVRVLTEDLVEMRLLVPEALKEKLDKLRLYFSHVNPEMTYLGLIEYLAEKALKKVFSKKDFSSFKAEAPEKDEREVRPKSRHISSTLRHAVWMRDKGVCSFKDQRTGRRCGGKYLLQVDHVLPWSRGGASTLENLQLLCAQHNRYKGAKLLPETERNVT